MNWYHKASGQAIASLGGFPVIYADPPWQYQDKKCNGAAEWHYRTMSLDALKALPVNDLAAPDAALFMWGTYPLIREMLEVGAAWGFTYKSIAFQWVKRYKNGAPFFGLGRWSRGNTEGCFLFTKGKPKRAHNGVSQLIETIEPEILDGEITRHSAKPLIVRDKIHQLMGSSLPSVELFARESGPDWEFWGDQSAQTVELR